MESLIYHWFDEELRKAILIIGSDEGLFYKPHALDDIRNFVVVTIRNSELEHLHSDDYRQFGMSERLPETAVKTITSEAIEYFGKLDFIKMSEEIEEPENDKYEGLWDRYPVAGQVLFELAGNKKTEYDFERIPVYKQPSLDALQILNEKQSVSGVSHGKIIEAFSDGYSFTIGADLKSHLLSCVESQYPLLVDSFKSLSRNLEKVLLIMEFLFSRWTPLVTTDFLISNGRVERRRKPLKAGHSHEDMYKNWRQTEGLGKYHKLFLNKAVTQNK
jgi:hypothetical protein